MTEVGKILVGCEKVLDDEMPDRILILGDTNSGLSSIPAKRKGIHVFHMEAGNRCYDDRVPEEVNRRIIDAFFFDDTPYTERSRRNLLREGFPAQRIFVTGNPILEVLTHYERSIDKSTIMDDLNVKKGKYFLATLHRAENVDDEKRLAKIVDGFNRIYKKYKMPIVWSVHPRTRNRLKKGIKMGPGIIASEPFGLFDFIKLEKNAACVLTDSGTVQEECCIFKVPNVTVRDVTERPETVEVGSNILSGAEPASILRCVDLVMHRPPSWIPPKEYLAKNVSGKVTRIVLGHHLV